MKVYRSERMGCRIIETYDRLLARWGCAVEERDIEGPYGATHVVVCGDEDRPPLVLFHGVGDDAALMWVCNAAELSRSFRLFAVDTLGGPGKSVPNAAYDRSFDDIRWIDGVLDGLGLDKVFLAGVSHGGYLTQAYALSRPERAMKGISISGAVPAGEGGSPMKTMMKIFLPEALLPTDRNVNRLIRKLCGDNSAVFTDNPDIMVHYKALLIGFNTMAMGFHKVNRFTADEIDAIRDKIVYLVGREDPFEKLGGEALLREYGMNAVFYDGAGHGLNHERADEINRKIVEILTAP